MKILAKHPDSNSAMEYTYEGLRQEFVEGRVTADWVARKDCEPNYRPVTEVLYGPNAAQERPFVTPRFLLFVLAVSIVLTVFMCPIRKPQVLFNMTKGTLIGHYPSVIVVPAFDLPTQKFTYIFTIKPWSKDPNRFMDYVTQHLSRDGAVEANEWSFALDYWLLINLLPSVLLGSLFRYWRINAEAQGEKT